MIATGLDIEERNRFERYILAGGEPKKFKWIGGSSSAQTGTTSPSSLLEKVSPSNQVPSMTADPFEVAKAQGRQVIFIDENGLAWTEKGQRVERTLDHFALPIAYLDRLKGTNG